MGWIWGKWVVKKQQREAGLTLHALSFVVVYIFVIMFLNGETLSATLELHKTSITKTTILPNVVGRMTAKRLVANSFSACTLPAVVGLVGMGRNSGEGVKLGEYSQEGR